MDTEPLTEDARTSPRRIDTSTLPDTLDASTSRGAPSIETLPLTVATWTGPDTSWTDTLDSMPCTSRCTAEGTATSIVDELPGRTWMDTWSPSPETLTSVDDDVTFTSLRAEPTTWTLQSTTPMLTTPSGAIEMVLSCGACARASGANPKSKRTRTAIEQKKERMA